VDEMMQKLVTILLAVVLSSSGSVLAQTKSAESDPKLAKRVEKLIRKAGVGIENQVNITQKDGTTLVGYVSQIKNDNFMLVDKATGAATNVSYSQVATVRVWSLTKNDFRKERPRPGSNFKVVGIGIAIGVGALLTACVVSKRCQN
jgi:hypothetical protein